MGCGTSELIASERESATARAHCGVHLRVEMSVLQVSRLLTPAVYEDGARGAAACASIVGIT